MRRFISVLLALVVCFSLACTVSAAADSTPNDSSTTIVTGNLSWDQGSTSNITFKVTGNVDTSKGASVGGAALGANDYKITQAADGSYSIVLNQSYLSTLSAGEYYMTVYDAAGNAIKIPFTVNARGVLSFFDNPKTGDMARMDLWVPMMAVSALALAVVMFFYFKKFRKVN